VIQALILLDEDLRGESSVTSVTSPASFFRGQNGVTPENITKTLRSNPVTDGFFSKNYKMALMFVGADIGTGEEQIQNFDQLLKEHIKNTPTPTGVKIGITGAPIIRMTIFDLLKRDAVLTLAVSATIILLLLFCYGTIHYAWFAGICSPLPGPDMDDGNAWMAGNTTFSGDRWSFLNDPRPGS